MFWLQAENFSVAGFIKYRISKRYFAMGLCKSDNQTQCQINYCSVCQFGVKVSGNGWLAPIKTKNSVVYGRSRKYLCGSLLLLTMPNESNAATSASDVSSKIRYKLLGDGPGFDYLNEPGNYPANE